MDWPNPVLLLAKSSLQLGTSFFSAGNPDLVTLHLFSTFLPVYVAGLYIGYFIAYVIMLVMQLQFMVTVLEAQRTLRVLNDLLEDLQHVIKQQSK